MSSKVAKRLVHLYKQMADLTAPECAKTCSVPWGCCNPFIVSRLSIGPSCIGE